jgi:MFS family permease
LAARRLGRLAENHGERSVLVLCLAFKPILMFALLVIPRDPTIAFWCLAPAFALDQALNAGIEIANNGFMLKRSPRENRTMFIAAGTAFAGTIGGLTAILAGAVLGATTTWSFRWQGGTMVNFHVLFALSVVLRMSAAVLATKLESRTSTTAQIVLDLFNLRPPVEPAPIVRPALRLDTAHVESIRAVRPGLVGAKGRTAA